MNTDEKKAQKAIDTIKSLRGKPGVDIYVNLAELHNDSIRIDVWEYNKKILSNKINMMNISENIRDDLSHVAVRSLFE